MVGKNRHSIRYKEYDYSKTGYYFITICSFNMKQLFGKITKINRNDKISNPEIILNNFGLIVKDEILKSELIRQEIRIDNYVIMPNHIHLIIEIINIDVGANGGSPFINFQKGECHSPLRPKMKNKSVSSFVSGLKYSITYRLRKISNNIDLEIWQRNYFDRIIRNEIELNKIRNYVNSNPVNWNNNIENILDGNIKI